MTDIWQDCNITAIPRNAKIHTMTTCQIPTLPGNARQVFVSEENISYLSVGYVCVDGYSLKTGDLTRICENGTWSGDVPVCEEMMGRQ